MLLFIVCVVGVVVVVVSVVVIALHQQIHQEHTYFIVYCAISKRSKLQQKLLFITCGTTLISKWLL